MKIYRDENVLIAARKRMEILFDNFEDIHVSISSGKDSTVMYYLALQEAIKRNRKIYVFFLDQEAEYENTIKIIEQAMTHENVIPLWYQVPIYMTNSTSYDDYFLYAWGDNEKWMREKNKIAIQKIDEDYPKRFYEFFPWYEQKNKNAAYLVGLRAEEGIIRYRAVTKTKGWNGYRWSTISNGVNKFYPIYDWTVYDVWKFIYDYNLPYNKIYDYMFIDNYSIYSKMRVSNLIHEKSYKCVIDLPRYEPETYNKLCKRISGIATASRYASEKLVFNNKVLPKHYKDWKEFRDFLINSIKNDEQKNKFITRFNKQDDDERTYKAQVGQLLIHDFENNRSFNTTKKKQEKNIREKWEKLL